MARTNLREGVGLGEEGRVHLGVPHHHAHVTYNTSHGAGHATTMTKPHLGCLRIVSMHQHAALRRQEHLWADVNQPRHVKHVVLHENESVRAQTQPYATTIRL